MNIYIFQETTRPQGAVHPGREYWNYMLNRAVPFYIIVVDIDTITLKGSQLLILTRSSNYSHTKRPKNSTL